MISTAVCIQCLLLRTSSRRLACSHHVLNHSSPLRFPLAYLVVSFFLHGQRPVGFCVVYSVVYSVPRAAYCNRHAAWHSVSRAASGRKCVCVSLLRISSMCLLSTSHHALNPGRLLRCPMGLFSYVVLLAWAASSCRALCRLQWRTQCHGQLHNTSAVRSVLRDTGSIRYYIVICNTGTQCHGQHFSRVGLCAGALHGLSA